MVDIVMTQEPTHFLVHVIEVGQEKPVKEMLMIVLLIHVNTEDTVVTQEQTLSLVHVLQDGQEKTVKQTLMTASHTILVKTTAPVKIELEGLSVVVRLTSMELTVKTIITNAHPAHVNTTVLVLQS